MAYRVKSAGHGKARCRIMTPVECIGRLVALIPPPRYPLTRFHGVLAPRAKLRPRIVPRLPTSAPCATPPATASSPPPPPPQRDTGPVIPRLPPVGAHALALAVPGAEVPAPNVVSVTHLARIAGGLLYAATSRVPWALLLRRCFEVDVLRCARCGGRVRVRAVVTNHAVAGEILACIAKKRARDPPGGVVA